MSEQAEAQVYQIVYDRTLMERITPIREAVRRCMKELQDTGLRGERWEAARLALLEAREQAELYVFDDMRGK